MRSENVLKTVETITIMDKNQWTYNACVLHVTMSLRIAVQSGGYNNAVLCIATYISNCCTICDMGWTNIHITIKINMLKSRIE